MRLKIKAFGRPESAGHDEVDLETQPCPAIMAGGIGGVGHGQYWVEESGGDMRNGTASIGSRRAEAKPPYRVPTMSEIRAIPWNGLRVASTFSGCGGSCTGYRMAGFRVVWANEFVPAAQDSYAANASEDCHLDRRDIKLVAVEDILSATGMRTGELDLFDGSPPCQAFSTAGKREKGWGQDRVYEHGARQRNETLFGEYIRLLRGLSPRTFVAENVSGLVKGVAKGFFLEILADLKASGYMVECRILDAQWLGVPQQRQRVIFVGVRNDVAREHGVFPRFPSPLPYRYSVRDALPWIDDVVQDPKGQFGVQRNDGESPLFSITASSRHHITVSGERHRPLPPSRKPGGNWVQEVKSDRPCPTVTCGSPGNDLAVPVRRKRVVAGSFQKFHRKEDVTDKPCPALLTGQPLHYMVENDGADSGDRGSDRGSERRKFTIAEIKRICAFPDDFVLTGSYSQQWERMGNSVPPVMMRAVAEAVRDGILIPARGAAS